MCGGGNRRELEDRRRPEPPPGLPALRRLVEVEPALVQALTAGMGPAVAVALAGAEQRLAGLDQGRLHRGALVGGQAGRQASSSLPKLTVRTSSGGALPESSTGWPLAPPANT
jgi:hypothetical protein